MATIGLAYPTLNVGYGGTLQALSVRYSDVRITCNIDNPTFQCSTKLSARLNAVAWRLNLHFRVFDLLRRSTKLLQRIPAEMPGRQTRLDKG